MKIILAMIISCMSGIGEGRIVPAGAEDIFSYVIVDVDGDSIQLDQFRGKKMLFVNLATSSPKAAQIGELQVLHKRYGSRVVVIGFPSNSFGHETRSGLGVRAYCGAQYEADFRLTAVNDVAGADCQPVYQWLMDAAKNGVASVTIQS